MWLTGVVFTYMYIVMYTLESLLFKHLLQRPSDNDDYRFETQSEEAKGRRVH